MYVATAGQLVEQRVQGQAQAAADEWERDHIHENKVFHNPAVIGTLAVFTPRIVDIFLKDLMGKTNHWLPPK